MHQRYGMIIRLKPGKYEEYKQLHVAVWHEVLDRLSKCNIKNYSIFHKQGYLFSYFEYHGANLDDDWKLLQADPKVREFWLLTDPCQEPVEGNSSGSVEGNWWIPMEELFHME